jgi:hypothetical protein
MTDEKDIYLDNPELRRILIEFRDLHARIKQTNAKFQERTNLRQQATLNESD